MTPYNILLFADYFGKLWLKILYFIFGHSSSKNIPTDFTFKQREGYIMFVSWLQWLGVVVDVNSLVK